MSYVFFLLSEGSITSTNSYKINCCYSLSSLKPPVKPYLRSAPVYLNGMGRNGPFPILPLRQPQLYRGCVVVLTCDRREVDSHQQGEEAGDVGHDVAVGRRRRAVLVRHRRQPSLLQYHALLQVVTKQVLWKTHRQNSQRAGQGQGEGQTNKDRHPNTTTSVKALSVFPRGGGGGGFLKYGIYKPLFQ